MIKSLPSQKTPDLKAVLQLLKSHANPADIESMKHFGIVADKALGVRMPAVREVAKAVGKHHDLAIQLWDTGIHEARILAALVAEPPKTTPALMDAWTNDFRSWDVCDQACSALFEKLPFAEEKALEYTKREEEFVKRTGFTMMAVMAVHHKKDPDAKFISWLPVIEREAWDERNFVKKAVNWALRQIGKRNVNLCHHAIQSAERILQQDTTAARWIAKDALREFEQKLPLLEEKDKQKISLQQKKRNL